MSKGSQSNFKIEIRYQLEDEYLEIVKKFITRLDIIDFPLSFLEFPLSFDPNNSIPACLAHFPYRTWDVSRGCSVMTAVYCALSDEGITRGETSYSGNFPSTHDDCDNSHT